MARQIELVHLRTFVVVAEELHFGRAAQRLHMAQPPVSQRIRALESALGAQLLYRTTRTVELTPIGRRLLGKVREILESVEALGTDVQRFREGEVGRIRIGFTDLVALSIMPQVAQEFRRRYPSIELDLRGSFFSFEEVDLLLEGELDVAFIHGPIQHRELISFPIDSSHILLAVAADSRYATRSKLSLTNIRDEPFITYLAGRGSTVRDMLLADCATAGFRPRIVQETQDSLAIVALVAAGVGVALVPDSMNAFRPSNVVYRQIDGVRSSVVTTVAWRRNEKSPALHRFLEVIRSRLEHTVEDNEPVHGA